MRKSVLCGVDIGGTKLAIGLLREDGRLFDSLTMHDHVRKEPERIVEQIVTGIRALLDRNSLAEEELIGVGVGTAGHLRHRDGVLITMSNLHGFEGYPLRDRIGAHFRVPVTVDNDANAQAFGELKYGAGVGFEHLVFMTVSTQIGSGIIIGGKLFRGMTGTAGEIGHTIVEPHTDLTCPCGNRGCLIAVASGVALPEVARRKHDAGLASAIVGGEGYDYAAVTGELVKRGLDAGDELCRSIVEDFADYIGIACYNAFQVFNPQAIVLGGGLMSWGAPFFDRIVDRFRSLAGKMMYEEVAVRRASVGASSGIVGAASLALEGT